MYLGKKGKHNIKEMKGKLLVLFTLFHLTYGE